MGRTKACDEGAIVRARRGRPCKNKKEENVQRTGFDGQATPPWRKTVSIFKQPVTLVVTSSRETKRTPAENQMKKTTRKSEFKPFPMLWSKSLEGITSCSPTTLTDKLDLEHVEYSSDSLQVVGKMTKACSVLDDISTAATLFNTLHNPLQPGAFGQIADREKIDANIFLNANPDQPMLSKISISQDEVHAQEKRVLDARKRLQEVLKHFG